MDTSAIAVSFGLAVATTIVAGSCWFDGSVKVARRLYHREDDPIFFHLVVGGYAAMALTFWVVGLVAAFT